MLPGVRPELKWSSELTPSEVQARVRARLLAGASTISGVAADGAIELHVPSHRQHFWSPELRVSLEATPTGTSLTGRFGPHPHVWALYLAAAGVTSFFLLVSASFGYAQWVMGEPPLALFGLPAGALLLIGLYAMSRLGQNFAKDQMAELTAYLQDALKSPNPQ